MVIRNEIKNLLLKIKPITYYLKGRSILNDPHYIAVQNKANPDSLGTTSRTDIINFLLSIKKNDTCYLEIGVRNPEHNFNHIKAETKFSVDPGFDFIENPVDFKMTSDRFFHKLSTNEVLSNKIRFDVIFIDGLHLAPQADKDIANALKYIKEDGFVVLHDCNPPTEWHSRGYNNYYHTPAGVEWNGTTWKAFIKWRLNPALYSCCIDSDWGVGILCKKYKIGNSIQLSNPFFEFNLLEERRKEYLNLMDFTVFKELILGNMDT
jgi:hypothetical protein